MPDNNIEAAARALLNTPQGSKVLSNIDQLKAFLARPEGQKLLSSLSGSNGDVLKRAAAAAADGDTENAKKLAASLLSTPEGMQTARVLAEMFKKK